MTLDKFQKLLQTCFNTETRTKTYALFAFMGKGAIKILKFPFRMTSGIIFSLEKISEQTKNPKNLFGIKKKTKKAISNPASGLIVGTSNMVYEIIGAISGLITEPIKGGKKEGFKGVTKGFGKGLYGLVFKPVAGTIDLITMTARGVENMPGTVYRNMFKIQKKVNSKCLSLKRKQYQDRILTDNVDMQIVAENDNEILYIDRKNPLAQEYLKTLELQKKPNKKESSVEDKEDDNNQNQQIENTDQEKVQLMINFYKQAQQQNLQDEELYEFLMLQYDEQQQMFEEFENVKQDEFQEFDGTATNKSNLNVNPVIEPKIYNNLLEINTQNLKLLNVKKNNIQTIYSSPKRKFIDNNLSNQKESQFFKMSGKGEEQESPDNQDKENACHLDMQPQFQMSNNNNNFTTVEINKNIFEDFKEKQIQFLKEDNNQQYQQQLQLDLTQQKQQDQFDSSQTDSPEKKLTYKKVLDSKFNIELKERLLIDDDNLLLMEEQKQQQLGQDQSNGCYQDSEINFLSNSDYDEEDEQDNDLVIIYFKKYRKQINYSKMSKNDIAVMIKNFKHLTQSDYIRHPHSNDKGGKSNQIKDIEKLYRNIGKEMISQIGRKLINGSFNLTTISFPIKVMIPHSLLEMCLCGTCFFPLYITMAAQMSDPLERFKLCIVASLCNFYTSPNFYKGLNPIIGETLSGSYNDGTSCYVEQISHHPPVSYFLIKGPNKLYDYYGYYNMSAKAGLNQLKLLNKGKRCFIFSDGQKIESNFGEECYSNIFLGTLKHETLGTIYFKDSKNNLRCDISFGKVKKRPSDYIESDIFQNDQSVGKVIGSYQGFLEINQKRYWDYRHIQPFQINLHDSKLPTDHQRRLDLQMRKKGDAKLAQLEKDKLELQQRNDEKNRKKHQKQ